MPDDSITIQPGLPGVLVDCMRQEEDTLIVSVRYRAMSRPHVRRADWPQAMYISTTGSIRPIGRCGAIR